MTFKDICINFDFYTKYYLTLKNIIAVLMVNVKYHTNRNFGIYSRQKWYSLYENINSSYVDLRIV